MNELEALIREIRPADAAASVRCREKWNKLAKPLHGLGLLEDMIAGLAGVDETLNLSKKCVLVFCSDNGIVREGVTQTGSEVTATVAANILKGEATVAKMSAVAGADVFPIDVGMNTEVEGVPAQKSRRGTEDFLLAPAMTREEALFAVRTGAELVREKREAGYRLIATGEMGIGNTTTSSAIAAVLLDRDVSSVTGKGAGLSDRGLQHKIDVIERAIELHRPSPDDPVGVLACLGGFDIAAMCGAFLGGARDRVPVLVDGFISSVAALLAVRICPEAKGFLFASHCSGEPAANPILAELGLTAPIRAGMALGEGTGAVALMPLLDMALNVYFEMPTFGETEIDEYQPL